MTTETGGGQFYRTDDEVEDDLRRFESCAVAPDDFKHRQHLTVALLYVLRLDERGARERMRDCLLTLLRHHKLDTRVYHETITAFWLRRVRAFAAGANSNRPLHELANDLIEQCGNPRLVFDYYSQGIIDSDEARAGWVEPDLKPLDF